MYICLTADNSKKSLLVNFCIAYKGILKKHQLLATEMTGKHVEQATGLPVIKFLPGGMGGGHQLTNEIMNGDIGLMICFHGSAYTSGFEDDYEEIARLCVLYNVPLATNIATAECLIQCLMRGDF